jgi:alkylation response protein AidB-like acyl-CoA dehydrogenase
MKTLTTWAAALKTISDRAQQVDIAGLWPRENIRDLHRCGALRWPVPVKYGGTGLAQIQLHRRYEQLASACLTTALILTQRDAALEFLICAVKSTPHAQRPRRLLSDLADHHLFASIGIAQLTTSGQHVNGGVRAVPEGRNWRITGVIPWSTGARHCDDLIAGARTQSGDQLLFILNMRKRGVQVLDAPMMAVLNASHTAAVKLNNVLISSEDILSGPCANALAVRNQYRRFSLNTCILPLGVAAGALSAARELAATRTRRCKTAIAALEKRHQQLSRRVYAQGADKVEADSATKPAIMRAQCNDHCFRSAAACLELAKGRGLLVEHPAQRRLREAMFFFVWSSGAGVIEETLACLAGLQ